MTALQSRRGARHNRRHSAGCQQGVRYQADNSFFEVTRAKRARVTFTVPSGEFQGDSPPVGVVRASDVASFTVYTPLGK